MPEDTLEKFEQGWNKIRKLTLTNRNLETAALPLRVLWSSLAERGGHNAAANRPSTVMRVSIGFS